MDQYMRKPFFHTLTALYVVHQAVLSPLNADDCIPQLQIQVGIDPSCILVLCHAVTCRHLRLKVLRLEFLRPELLRSELVKTKTFKARTLKTFKTGGVKT